MHQEYKHETRVVLKYQSYRGVDLLLTCNMLLLKGKLVEVTPANFQSSGLIWKPGKQLILE